MLSKDSRIGEFLYDDSVSLIFKGELLAAERTENFHETGNFSFY